MARSLWSDRPLGVKLAALVGAGAAVAGRLRRHHGAGAGGHRATDRRGSCSTSAEATGEALEADMMHDAVRADVLQALLSARRARSTQSAVTDLAEHSAQLPRHPRRRSPTSTSSPEVDAAVEAVTPAVEQYLTSADADHRRSPARTRRGRTAAYPAFLAAFSALEDELPTVGDGRRGRGGGRRAGRAPTSGAPRSRSRSSSPAVGVLVLAPARLGRHPLGRRPAAQGRRRPRRPGRRRPARHDRRRAARTRSAGWPPRSRPRWPTCGRS